MGFGRKLPKGRLPVFSVETEDDARALIVASCPRDTAGHFYARELAEEQTLENLERFAQRLERTWALIQARRRRYAPQRNIPEQR